MNCKGTLNCITMEPCLAAFFEVDDPTAKTMTVEFTVHNDYDYDHRSLYDYITITKIGTKEIVPPYKASAQKVSTKTYESADEGKQVIALVLGLDRFTITDISKA